MLFWSWRRPNAIYGWLKELGNWCHMSENWKSVVEQIFSSNKRITTTIQVERGHYKFDLSSSSKNRLRDHCGIVQTCGLHEACDLSIVDMMHARLHLSCYDQLCRPDVSLGAHSSLKRSFLGNLKLRRRNLRWAMSIKSSANFLTITCIRICLKMNQWPSPQRRSVPQWRGELRRRILKQRWVD